MDRNETATLKKMGAEGDDIWLACQLLVDEHLHERTVVATKEERSRFSNTSDQYKEWKYTVAITMRRDDITETLENFPMPFEHEDFLNANDVQRTGQGFFFVTADGNIKLAHQIRSWNYVTGNLVATILFPKVIPSTDIEFYLYYGNLHAEDQQAREEVWREYSVQRFYNDASDRVREFKFQLAVLELLFPGNWLERNSESAHPAVERWLSCKNLIDRNGSLAPAG